MCDFPTFYPSIFLLHRVSHALSQFFSSSRASQWFPGEQEKHKRNKMTHCFLPPERAWLATTSYTLHFPPPASIGDKQELDHHQLTHTCKPVRILTVDTCFFCWNYSNPRSRLFPPVHAVEIPLPEARNVLPSPAPRSPPPASTAVPTQSKLDTHSFFNSHLWPSRSVGLSFHAISPRSMFESTQITGTFARTPIEDVFCARENQVKTDHSYTHDLFLSPCSCLN